MMNADDRGVLISDGRSGVRLIRTDSENELGYPTLIYVQAGPFGGSVRDDTVGSYLRFRNQLTELHNQLVGVAKLSSHDGFDLVLVGNGRGAIEVRANVVGQHVPSVRLVFEFAVDQTYLPKIIREIDTEFPCERQSLSTTTIA